MNSEKHIQRFINIPISHYFLYKLEEYNAIFGQQQIENIYFTISLIDNKCKQDKILHLIKINIQKCISWCTKYNVPINHIPISASNIFLDTPEIDEPHNIIIFDEQIS